MAKMSGYLHFSNEHRADVTTLVNAMRLAAAPAAAIREAYAREQAAAASQQPQGAAKAASWKRKRLFGDATNTAPKHA